MSCSIGCPPIGAAGLIVAADQPRKHTANWAFRMTDPHLWWYVTRASGLVAWAAITGSVLWGVLLATRVVRSIDNRHGSATCIAGLAAPR